MKEAHRSDLGSLRHLVETEAHHRLGIALAVAILTFVAMFSARVAVKFIASWDAFAVSSLLLAWLGMFFSDARTRVREARLQDSSRGIICCCVVLASVASLFGAGVVLGSAEARAGGAATRYILLVAFTVISSWLLVHTILALHYTHVFYSVCDETSQQHGSGVTFPNETNPDFLDFAYFSFVIGMTCQVSDIEVTSRRMRRIVLVHGLLSFGFNTVILAFSINLASTLL